VRDFLKLRNALERPELSIAAEDQKWAAQRAGELGPKLVLLFPQSLWKTREWPANYWVDLSWKLKQAGASVLVLIQNEDTRFQNTPLFQWNTPIPRLAALMQRAALVIGNDSFPAHLAGTVGTPTIALLGPTRPTVFAHMSNVDCLASGRIDCTGCHFQAPFRAACDQGCMSLYRLFPDDVLKHALVKLAVTSTK
jgi:ADP-heptose:LPS heptosyltransferase